MKKRQLALLAVLNLTACTSEAKGDIKLGEQKAQTCAACHGAKGVSVVASYPNLAGQKEQYLIKQLKDFKTKVRNDPVMTVMAMPLSEQDIKNISAYYASLDPRGQ